MTGGKVLDHQLYAGATLETMRAKTRDVWEKKFPHVPFDFFDISTYKEGSQPENSKPSSAGT